MSLPKSFAACSFAPATKDEEGNPTLISPSPIGTWKTTSFFIDSSGRSSFALPLQLSFASKQDLDVFLASDCLDPSPGNVVKEEEEQKTDDSSQQQSESFVGFEVKSYSVDESKAVVVEGITILSCSVEDLVVCFQTEVTVRASNHQYDSPKDSSGMVDPHNLNILANLEVTPVLTIKKMNSKENSIDIPDRLALELGAIPDHMQKESSARVHETRLASMALNVTLTHAFTIAVKSIQGSSLGKTLVSLTIRHSDSHSEPITISNIALHPGHSRYETLSRTNRRMSGSKYAVSKLEAIGSRCHRLVLLTNNDLYSQLT
jgi:hypothetical protein